MTSDVVTFKRRTDDFLNEDRLYFDFVPVTFSIVALFQPSIPSHLFFSVFPDSATAVRIARVAWNLRREYRLSGRPLCTPRFHCSLYGFDDRDGPSFDVVARAREAARSVIAPPFRVSFNGVKTFSGRAAHHPVVLVGDDGVVGLTLLYSSLCVAMRKVGLRPKQRREFTPHLTLLYTGDVIDEQQIEPIYWTVCEFALILSLIGRTKYIPLGRWQLRPYAESKLTMCEERTTGLTTGLPRG